MSSSDVTEIGENTPLLGHLILPANEEPRLLCNPRLWIIMIIFTFGATIGVYLLYIENAELPISKAFFLIRRSKWGSTKDWHGVEYPATEPPVAVLITQVANHSCLDIEGCSQIVRDIQLSQSPKYSDVPFNFLVGGDATYQAQGWKYQSLFFPSSLTPLDGTKYLVLAFIGNFTETLPHEDQLEEAQSWVAESIFRNRLNENYQIFGLRNLTASRNDGEMLFTRISKWPRFNSTLGAHV